MAGQWEIGGAAGYGWHRDVTLTNPAAPAKAGFDAGLAAGMVIGEDLYQHLGGEFRYTYRKMDGEAHAFHYDLLLHATRKASRVRPFVAGGGGIKWFRSAGTEQTEGLISFGGGVKASLSKHAIFRIDFRDYLTPFPDKLIVLPRGAKIRGWLHDFVPMAGISFTF